MLFFAYLHANVRQGHALRVRPRLHHTILYSVLAFQATVIQSLTNPNHVRSSSRRACRSSLSSPHPITIPSKGHTLGQPVVILANEEPCEEKGPSSDRRFQTLTLGLGEGFLKRRLLTQVKVDTAKPEALVLGAQLSLVVGLGRLHHASIHQRLEH